MTAGELLLEAAARHGLYGVMSRSFGPQIRGGEAAALLRLATHPVEGPDDRYDLLVGLDWGNVERFAEEMPLGPESLVLSDPGHGEIPDVIRAARPRIEEVPLGDIARQRRGGRTNMVALGLVSRLLELPPEVFRRCIETRFEDKGAVAVDSAMAAFEQGLEAPMEARLEPLATAAAGAAERWRISGNQATGLGAVRGGVRFVGGYPITPATDVLEWLAAALPRAGGTLLQAEDELSAINMCLGASFGGVPALTATSGPGFSLMVETLGLAVAAEVPLVVVDVMRGGPSTGIPTKSEQTDLNIAAYGLHGDAPHLVLAPIGIADCAWTTQWAVALAEALQVPAIVLSDQALGQSRAVIDAPRGAPPQPARRTAQPAPGETYHRYEDTEDGVSPMALPGTPHGMYTADGLEHTEDALPSSRAADHARQLDKRRRKLTAFDYGADALVVEGDGPLAIITWGSATAAAREAVARARDDGIEARLVALRLIAPLPGAALARALEGARAILVVEQNHDGQLHRYLRAHHDFPAPVAAFHHAGPLALRPGMLTERLRALASTAEEETA